MCIVHQISLKLVKWFARYCNFLISQDGGRLQPWFCLERIWTTHEEYLKVFVIRSLCKNLNNSYILLENAQSRSEKFSGEGWDGI